MRPAGDSAPIETDALVIGAGPIGLFQMFQLGLLGVSAHVVDALPHPGGQCVELYGDKPIYDIPGIPVCTGRELIGQLLKQAEPFQPTFHLGQEVSALRQEADGRFHIETTTGTRFLSKTVFIAAGVGAFVPKVLKVEGLERHLGRHVFHHPPAEPGWSGRDVLIVGGEDSALEWACRLSDPLAAAQGHATGLPASVTLVHRRDNFKAEPQRIAAFRQAVSVGRVHLAVGQPVELVEDAGEFRGLRIVGPDGEARTLPADFVLVQLGLSPRLGPLADWGFVLERKQLPVDTESFGTTLPGVFAVGDVNTYPGKKKLILCGFHEATLAAYGAMRFIRPGEPVHLQYTTTSPRLQQLLGVAPTLAGIGTEAH